MNIELPKASKWSREVEMRKCKQAEEIWHKSGRSYKKSVKKLEKIQKEAKNAFSARVEAEGNSQPLPSKKMFLSGLSLSFNF